MSKKTRRVQFYVDPEIGKKVDALVMSFARLKHANGLGSDATESEAVRAFVVPLLDEGIAANRARLEALTAQPDSA